MKLKWIFCFIWIFSLVVFVGAAFLAPNNYAAEPNDYWGGIFGTSVVVGSLSFLLMLVFTLFGKKSASAGLDANLKVVEISTKQKSHKKPWAVITIILAIILAGILYLQIPQDFIKRQQLVTFYENVTNAETERNWEVAYMLMTPEQRRQTSLNDYVLLRNKSTIPVSTEYTVHSYLVEGDRGIIDRTLVVCYTSNCSGEDRFEQRAKKEYVYINGKWYIPEDNTIFCDRKQPYAMPAEFDRALSLIIQRLENSQYSSGTEFEKEDRLNAKMIKGLRNCLDIQYAGSKAELSGAEGVFYFNQNSDINDLTILVAPDYVAKDDLLTATLLRHELQHAIYHATGADKSMSCVENEANAFSYETGFFLGALNQEERNSIITRYNLSPEARGLVDLINYMVKNTQYTYYDAAANYVKASPFYQNQCK